MGTLHLPGTLQRCQSAPNMVVTSPIGWAKDPWKTTGFLVCVFLVRCVELKGKTGILVRWFRLNLEVSIG